MKGQAFIGTLDDPLCRQRWEALELLCPAPFAQTLVLTTLARHFGRRVEVILSDADRNVLATALLVRHQHLWHVAAQLPLLPYAALRSHAATAPSPEQLAALLELLEHRYARIDLHLPPGWVDVRAALWRGWRARPLYTYQLSLTHSGPEHWSENPRRLFRKARAQYHFVEDAALAPALAQLVRLSYARHRRHPPLPETQLRTLLEELLPSGLLRLFGVLNDRAYPEAAVALLVHPPHAWYWLAGSEPGPAMTVLLGELWQRLQAEGFETFDFVGANTPSIAEFKRRFKPKLRLYFRLEYDRSALHTLLRRLPGLR